MRITGLAGWLAMGTWICGAQSLPLEPPHEAGDSITGAFEGWFANPDGSYSLLLGYFNRNTKEEIEIPIGPENRIEPGGPDRGQPTHFLPGRQWGMFTIKVPHDFGQNKLTWAIVANGKPMVIPVSLHPDYEISPFREAAVGNTPPFLAFDEHGRSGQGPVGLLSERTAKVGSPLSLTVWVTDDAKMTTSSGAPSRNAPVTLRWSKFRGPGEVTFSEIRPAIEKTPAKDAGFAGKASTAATFTAPGLYFLHVTANDYSGEGGGGFQCCWSTAQIQVSVQR
jgi:hypothetical protein